MQHAKVNKHTEHFSQHWKHLLERTLRFSRRLYHMIRLIGSMRNSVYSTLARNRAYLTAKDTDFLFALLSCICEFPCLSYGD